MIKEENDRLGPLGRSFYLFEIEEENRFRGMRQFSREALFLLEERKF